MTPSDIEVLIHCHVSPSPHPRLGSPAVIQAVLRFERDGLIREALHTPTIYTTTPKGAAHIDQLCNLPYPTSVWTGVNGEIIK